MRGLGAKTKAAILNAKTADEAIGLLMALARKRTSDAFENQFQIKASHGRFEIVFPAQRGGFTIRRTGMSRLDVLEFVAGLQKG